jgi:hypothetical protein
MAIGAFHKLAMQIEDIVLQIEFELLHVPLAPFALTE